MAEILLLIMTEVVGGGQDCPPAEITDVCLRMQRDYDTHGVRRW